MWFLNYLTFFLILVIYSKAEFYQNSYDIVPDRFELLEYNRTAVLKPNFSVFKYNETLKMKAMNISGIFTTGAKKTILCNFEIYKLINKKYLSLPTNITLELCDEYRKLGNKNPFGIQEVLLLSNFRGCPARNGLYYIYNWALEQDLFPPHLPLGKYKLGISVTVDDVIFLFRTAWYGELVKRGTAA